MLGKGQEGGTQASSKMEELLLRKSGRTQPTDTWAGREVHADFQLWDCKSYRRVTLLSLWKLLCFPTAIRN